MVELAMVELLERDAQLDQLRTAFGRASDGEGAVVLVSGEAGIGKTSLLRAFAAEVGTRARHYWGSCEHLLAARPLGPFRDIVRDNSPTFDDLGDDADRDDYIEGFLRELRLAGRPALLVVDDLQWADDASLDVVRYLGRRMADMSAVMCLSYRPIPGHDGHPLPQITGAFTGRSTVRIELKGLSDETVATEATMAGLDPTVTVAAVGGNPFYLTEVIAAPDRSVPPTVRDAIVARLHRLTDQQRRVVEIVSQFPMGPDWEAFEAIAGLQASTAPLAGADSFVEVLDGRFRFRHDLAQRAVAQSLTEAESAQLNRAILGYLETTDAELSLLVHHAVVGHDFKAVACHAPRAAQEAAAAGAHRDAVQLCQLALEQREHLAPADEQQLHTTTARAAYMANEFGLASEHANAAVRMLQADGVDPARLGEACLTASRMRTMTGDPAGARSYATRAIEILQSLEAGPTLALAYGTMGCLDAIHGRNREAVEWCTKAIEIARDQECPENEAYASIYLGLARVGLGNDAGFDDMKRAIEISDRIGHAEYLFRSSANLGVLLIWAGRHDDALPYVQMSSRIAADNEMDWGVFHARSQESNVDIYFGRWDQAEARLRTLLTAGDDPGAVATMPLALLGRILVRRGDPEGRALTDQAWEMAVTSGESFRIAAAGLSRIEAAWLADDTSVVHELADEMIRIATAYNLRYFHGEVLRYLKRAGGTAEPFQGCLDAHGEGLVGNCERAAELWLNRGNRYHAALELIESADPEVAISGVRMLDELGAAGTAAVVRRTLRHRGVTGVPRGPRPDTRDNAVGLTPRQTDVLNELAAGLTNSEIAETLFVSTRTIDHHVAAIFSKLNVSCRRDAARVAQDLGLVCCDDAQDR